MTESVVAGEAKKFSDAERRDFMGLVQEGGEVADVVLKRNIDRAKRLVFLRAGAALVGVAALKVPEVSYRKRIAARSGVNVPEADFPLELGYVFVAPAHRERGHSRTLVEAALNSIREGIYATSRAGNVSMHRTLERYEFKAMGKPYPGRDQVIQLFVRLGR